MRLIPPPHPLTSLLSFALSVPPPKVIEYLLNPDHPENKGKAEFFAMFGFTRQEFGVLSVSLATQAFSSADVKAEPHPLGYGMRINATGPIDTPSGRRPVIRTAWRWFPATTVDNRLERADFVTAFPD